VNIILFGPPGAGKGTQADKIIKSFNLHKISTGELLRKEIQQKTYLGEKIKHIIGKGKFVSDNIINDLIVKIINDKKIYNQLLFDGYPRNLDQAKNLDQLLNSYKQKISCVLSLKVEKEVIVKRILGRQTCSKCGLIFNEFYYRATEKNHLCGNKFLIKRSDDNEKTITQRYETYLSKTLPIFDYYNKLNLLHEIDGKIEIDQIFDKISHIIASLEA